jgi:hypothetical protein
MEILISSLVVDQVIEGIRLKISDDLTDEDSHQLISQTIEVSDNLTGEDLHQLISLISNMHLAVAESGLDK